MERDTRYRCSRPTSIPIRWCSSGGGSTTPPRVVASPEAMARGLGRPRGSPVGADGAAQALGRRTGSSSTPTSAAARGASSPTIPVPLCSSTGQPLGRQVRIEGPSERTGDDESDAYFATRPRGGTDRGPGLAPERDHRRAAERWTPGSTASTAEYAGRDVPRPPWWGGLRVRPESFEFWQNRHDRLHDRLRYTPRAGGWPIARLQP